MELTPNSHTFEFTIDPMASDLRASETSFSPGVHCRPDGGGPRSSSVYLFYTRFRALTSVPDGSEYFSGHG